MLTKESYRNKDRESGEIMIEGNGTIVFFVKHFTRITC